MVKPNKKNTDKQHKIPFTNCKSMCSEIKMYLRSSDVFLIFIIVDLCRNIPTNCLGEEFSLYFSEFSDFVMILKLFRTL